MPRRMTRIVSAFITMVITKMVGVGRALPARSEGEVGDAQGGARGGVVGEVVGEGFVVVA